MNPSDPTEDTTQTPNNSHKHDAQHISLSDARSVSERILHSPEATNSPRTFSRQVVAIHSIILLLIPLLYFSSINVPEGALLPLIGLLTVIFAITSTVFFIMQLNFIKKHLNDNQLYSRLLALVVIGGAIPMLGVILGDVSGTISFNTPEQNLAPFLYPVIMLVCMLILVWALSFATIIKVTMRTVPKALGIIGFIAYVLLWILCAVAGYFLYAITYSLHDPATE